MIFSAAGNKKKIMKNLFFGAERIGLLPNYIVKKKMYCNIEIVLQETGEKAVNL